MYRNTNRRGARVVALGVAVTAAMTLSACGPDITGGSEAGGDALLQAPTAEQPEGEITIWDRSGDLFEVFEAAIDDFTAKYPGITVHHEAVDIDAKLQNALITGTDVPDGVFLDDAKVGGFADYLWDLSDVLAPYLADIAPQKVEVNSVDGGVFGVPFDLDPGLLWYNATELDAAGIDVEDIETYDDLIEAARAYQAVKPEAKPIHLEQSAFLGQLQLEANACSTASRARRSASPTVSRATRRRTASSRRSTCARRRRAGSTSPPRCARPSRSTRGRVSSAGRRSTRSGCRAACAAMPTASTC